MNERFQVRSVNGRYQVIDTTNNRACMYTGAATNPPKYVGDGHRLRYHEWDNYYLALDFAHRLEWACASLT